MYGQAPEPPEAQTIRSMLHIARILAIIFGIIILLGGIAYAAFVAYLASVCSTYIGYDPYCGSAVASALIPAIWLVIAGVVAVLVYMQMRSIEDKVNAHQYEAAKSQTLIWMILGFIFGILLGIILLIAYIKFDPLITASRQQPGQMPPAYGAPPPMAPAPAPSPTGPAPPYGTAPAAAPAPMGAAPAMASAPPPPPAGAPAVPFCSNCGRPTTYVPQYGRYYCYACKQYV